MRLLERVLREPELEAEPPVLLDIGAATHLPELWRCVARHSIGIAFDPDRREMDYAGSAGSAYRELHVIPAIVSADVDGEATFYLTASPECSSTLEPDEESLRPWVFAPFFQVERECRLPAVTLGAVLRKLGIDRIDYYKSDTQGTDLRIFASLPEKLRRRILALEFEPGFIDAYRREDKLWELLAFLEKEKCFRLTGFDVHGSVYFPGSERLSPFRRRLLPTVHRSSPGWAEMRYLNCLRGADFTRRDYLLGWVFALLHGEYGFALEIAEAGAVRFPGALWEEMAVHALKAPPFLRPVAAKVAAKLKRCFFR